MDKIERNDKQFKSMSPPRRPKLAKITPTAVSAVVSPRLVKKKIS